MKYKKMVEDIDKLVEVDFAFDMDCKQMPNSKPYTQEESMMMAHLIGRIYSISHSLHCKACSSDYK